jgi:hypothetical protein
MLSKSRITMFLGAAAAIAALVATVALGTTTKRFDSKVTLAKSDPFHGRVVSDKHACEVKRTVKILVSQPGPDDLYGRTKTDKQGNWSKPATPNGDFYAVVKRRSEGTAGTIFVCKSDTTRVRHFGM